MTRRRLVLSVLLFAALALALALGVPTGSPSPSGSVAAAAPDDVSAFADSGDEVLQRVARRTRASADGDVARLVELSSGSDVAALRAARDLALRGDVDPALRRVAVERVLALRIDEPLARAERTAWRLALGDAAEAAGDVTAALTAYRDALPDPLAVEAVARLEPDRYRLANAYLQARLYDEALTALGDLAAPSIEAPALRALGRYDEARDAYRRWLAEIPGDLEARTGLAWTHWYLDDLDAGEELFTDLGGANARYGLALIANRRGDIDAAVELLVSTGDARRLWLATTLLEGEARWDDAAQVYRSLAAGASDYADDAAWRLRVLGLRHDRSDWIAAGEAALPADGWFAQRLGAAPPGPSRNDLPEAHPDALATARALAEANDLEGARLVLQFALRETQAAGAGEAGPEAYEAAVVALGEALAAMGDHRTPQRSVAPLLTAGSQQYRTWRLAYPEAWPDLVRLEAKHAGVDPHLVWAVMRRESAFFPDAVSRSGAQGLMQVMPATWDWLAEIREEPPGDPFAVDDNIRYGVTYLGWLHDYFSGDELLMVPSYNRGQGYIGRLYDSEQVRRDDDELLRRIDALETREYLQAVLRARAIYEALATSPVASR